MAYICAADVHGEKVGGGRCYQHRKGYQAEPTRRQKLEDVAIQARVLLNTALIIGRENEVAETVIDLLEESLRKLDQ